MTWQSIADSHVNEPTGLIEIAWNSGTRYYALNYVRTSAQSYKGNALNISNIRSSVGDITRTYERNKISIIFNDSDYEFRTLEENETVGFTGISVIVTVSFRDDAWATSQVVFTGQIYDWRRLDNLQFEIMVEEVSKNLENEYPWKEVDRTDYATAHSSAIGKTILIPYGTISASGLSGDGAFGYPSLYMETGLPFVDTTQDAEQHLVGLQTAAITVDRVYIDDVVKVEGGGNDYTISTQVIGGFTHTEIHWEAGVRPTETSKVTCDITFGARLPVEAIKHFLENFPSWASGDFNAASYNAAHTKEGDRSYTFDGALCEKKALTAILDEWRDEYELDIYWNTAGEVCFNYLSSILPASTNHYTAELDILSDFDSDPQVSQIMNHMKYGFNFHYAKSYYYNFDTYEDTDSQTKYGKTVKLFKGFRWIRSSTIAHDIASRKVIRFKTPITFDAILFPLKTFSDNLTDPLKITHFTGAGSAGYAKKLFQIRAAGFNLTNYTNEMLLEDASSFFGAACILGDDTVQAATWATASSGDRDYCYMCDVTSEQFLDGEPGKRLFD